MIHRRDAERAEGAEKSNSGGLTHAVIGAAIEVHRILGPGLLEELYEASLSRELYLRGLAFRRQVRYPIEYKGVELGSGLRLDLLVEDTLVVEVKSVDHLAQVHRSQLLTYLKLSGLQLGLLINFNVATLRSGVRRVIRTGRRPLLPPPLCGEQPHHRSPG